MITQKEKFKSVWSVLPAEGEFARLFYRLDGVRNQTVAVIVKDISEEYLFTYLNDLLGGVNGCMVAVVIIDHKHVSVITRDYYSPVSFEISYGDCALTEITATRVVGFDPFRYSPHRVGIPCHDFKVHTNGGLGDGEDAIVLDLFKKYHLGL